MVLSQGLTVVGLPRCAQQTFRWHVTPGQRSLAPQGLACSYLKDLLCFPQFRVRTGWMKLC